jgi:hypothetical protein
VGKRRMAVLAVLTLVAVAAVVAPSTAAVAAECPAGGFTSTLSNGQVKIGNLDPATGATATACGLVAFQPDGSLRATIARDNLSFARLSVPIALFDVDVQITPASDFSGPVTLAADGIHLTLSGQVVATVRVLLNTCTIGPFTSTLTTGTSGSLTGRPFNGPSQNELTGRLVGNEDPVPAAGHSLLRCPLLISGVLNAITGLPSPAGESFTTFDASLDLAPAA